MATLLANAKFNLILRPLKCMTATFCKSLESEWDLDYRYLYALLFFLLVGAFFHSLVDLKSCLFLSLSIKFYYSSIKKINLKHISIYTFYSLSLFRVPSNSVLFCSHLFYFRLTSNFILLQSLFFYFRVTSNFISPCIQ